ncbi:MAG: heme-binding domain-containing protein [Phaeodactylibacter sp.]|uniref:heme-binding domain-containing protein n=1 Tax=Phaeodactylibacter sp. TaxID=1940289 RepID=UPI0032EDFDD9
MSKLIKRILFGLLGIFVILQFFQIDKTNPTAPEGQDFITVIQPPEDVVQILKDACYDCHSHQTTYPWYTNIQPVGWWLKGHIEEAREHLNFSTWAAYDAEKRAHKAEESAEEVGEGYMPLKAYPLTHPEARLSDEQRDRLVTWFEALADGRDISKRLREKAPLNSTKPVPAHQNLPTE